MGKDVTSRMWGLLPPNSWSEVRPCTVSRWLSSDTLSLSNSFISTNCPLTIFSTSLWGSDSAAGDSIKPGWVNAVVGRFDAWVSTGEGVVSGLTVKGVSTTFDVCCCGDVTWCRTTCWVDDVSTMDAMLPAGGRTPRANSRETNWGWEKAGKIYQPCMDICMVWVCAVYRIWTGSDNINMGKTWYGCMTNRKCIASVGPVRHLLWSWPASLRCEPLFILAKPKGGPMVNLYTLSPAIVIWHLCNCIMWPQLQYIVVWTSTFFP